MAFNKETKSDNFDILFYNIGRTTIFKSVNYCCTCCTCYTTSSAPPRNYIHKGGTLFCPAPNLFTTCNTAFKPRLAPLIIVEYFFTGSKLEISYSLLKNRGLVPKSLLQKTMTMLRSNPPMKKLI